MKEVERKGILNGAEYVLRGMGWAKQTKSWRGVVAFGERRTRDDQKPILVDVTYCKSCVTSALWLL